MMKIEMNRIQMLIDDMERSSDWLWLMKYGEHFDCLKG